MVLAELHRIWYSSRFLYMTIFLVLNGAADESMLAVKFSFDLIVKYSYIIIKRRKDGCWNFILYSARKKSILVFKMHSNVMSDVSMCLLKLHSHWLDTTATRKIFGLFSAWGLAFSLSLSWPVNAFETFQVLPLLQRSLFVLLPSASIKRDVEEKMDWTNLCVSRK